jgi:DNA polymerase III epsilon subunit-like protein
MRMLIQDLARIDMAELLVNRPVFCTMRYFRKKHPKRAYALVDLAQFYSISLTNFRAHSALEDAELLGTVFSQMSEEQAKKPPATQVTLSQIWKA